MSEIKKVLEAYESKFYLFKDYAGIKGYNVIEKEMIHNGDKVIIKLINDKGKYSIEMEHPNSRKMLYFYKAKDKKDLINLYYKEFNIELPQDMIKELKEINNE